MLQPHAQFVEIHIFEMMTDVCSHKQGVWNAPHLMKCGQCDTLRPQDTWSRTLGGSCTVYSCTRLPNHPLILLSKSKCGWYPRANTVGIQEYVPLLSNRKCGCYPRANTHGAEPLVAAVQCTAVHVYLIIHWSCYPRANVVGIQEQIQLVSKSMCHCYPRENAAVIQEQIQLLSKSKYRSFVQCQICIMICSVLLTASGSTHL